LAVQSGLPWVDTKREGFPSWRYEAYEFDAKYRPIHDMIDPGQLDQQTALVYPILLDLITHEIGE